jgi:hypothetical protein
MSFNSRVKKRKEEMMKAVQQHEQSVIEQNDFRHHLIEDSTARLNKLWMNDPRNYKLHEFIGTLQSNSELQEALRFIWSKWEIRANNWLRAMIVDSQKPNLEYFVVPEGDISFTPEEANTYESVVDTWPSGLYPEEDGLIQNRQLLTDKQIMQFLEWKLPYLCSKSHYSQDYARSLGSGVRMKPDWDKHTWKGQSASYHPRRQILIRLNCAKLDEQVIAVFLDEGEYPRICKSCKIEEVLEFLVDYSANL